MHGLFRVICLFPLRVLLFQDALHTEHLLRMVRVPLRRIFQYYSRESKCLLMSTCDV